MYLRGAKERCILGTNTEPVSPEKAFAIYARFGPRTPGRSHSWGILSLGPSAVRTLDFDACTIRSYAQIVVFDGYVA